MGYEDDTSNGVTVLPMSSGSRWNGFGTAKQKSEVRKN
jgi:hypothetical protein